MEMLTLEMSGQSFNKSEFRRNLVKRLDGRTEGSVEKKNQNISAILHENNCFWISGYKPQFNVQGILRDEVSTWIETHPEFERIAMQAAESSVVVAASTDFEKFEVEMPSPKEPTVVQEPQDGYGTSKPPLPVKMNYLALEARNRSLGLAGEETVVQFEQYRLSKAKADRWADKVEHVSRTKGDGLGFDVLSFDPDGRERFIEVKTTAFSKETSFFASANEVKFSEKNSKAFHLYRLFEYKKSPRCFVVPGSISDQCKLDPVSYRCSLI